MERCLHGKKWHEMLCRNFVYNFNISNKYDDEWYLLQSKIKEYTKIHEINGWEILCLMMNLTVWKTHSKIHCLDINVQGIEPYDLTFECSRQLKEKIHIRTHYQFQTLFHKWMNVYLMNECIPNEFFFSHMKQLKQCIKNCWWRYIVKEKTNNKTFTHIFLLEVHDHEKIPHFCVLYIKHVKLLHKRHHWWWPFEIKSNEISLHRKNDIQYKWNDSSFYT